ncbi:MAG TPA: hypothetical protein VGM80_07180 [Gaiellaceae bacterium]|jgi:hypothetical protein
MTGGYEALLALAYRERDLVEAGRFEALEALGNDWEALTKDLPEPTNDERKLLEEIEVTVWSTVAALRLAMDDTVQLMSLVQRGRRAIDSYADAGVPTAATSFT